MTRAVGQIIWLASQSSGFGEVRPQDSLGIPPELAPPRREDSASPVLVKIRASAGRIRPDSWAASPSPSDFEPPVSSTPCSTVLRDLCRSLVSREVVGVIPMHSRSARMCAEVAEFASGWRRLCVSLWAPCGGFLWACPSDWGACVCSSWLAPVIALARCKSGGVASRHELQPWSARFGAIRATNNVPC